MPSSLKGHYPVLTSDYFYKFAFKNRKFFLYEKDTVCFLKEQQDLLKYIPNYIYRHFYFKSEVLNPVLNEDEQFAFASEILSALENFGKKENLTLEELPLLVEGLTFLKNLFGDTVFEECKKRAEFILSTNVFRVGFAHGDFHSKNIMKKNNHPVMIDLDCFRKRSIQEFDAIYFILQSIVDLNFPMQWYDGMAVFESNLTNNERYNQFLAKFIDISHWKDILFLVCLDRFGQEYRYVLDIRKFQADKIKPVLNFFGLL